ncbi:MAG: selenide, water dikinase SelD [Deltaproteobacteria bacterium]|nr:selenide, water dikinase SelD [Deltaproteobacteria bacterium]
MIRLTEYARGGGCAAKLRLNELNHVLKHMPGAGGAPRADILVDHSFSDDAAVVHHAAGRGLVLTADVIAPLVDDPEAFGAIAATNSMSDVWAMGGEPRFALNLVFFSDEVLGIEVLDAILAGAAKACDAAGVAIVGGHSVRDPEVKFGLSVTGEVSPGSLWSNRKAKAGQALVLTKALGTGVMGQAIKKRVAGEIAAAAAIRSMTTLNKGAAEVGREHGVTSATDVTGFGLLGHLRNILHGSGVAARLQLDQLPLLPEAKDHLRNEICPAGSKANRAYVANLVRWANGDAFTGEPANSEERELLASLACDAQTSGGLLLCVPAERAAACVAALRDQGLPAAQIGEVVPRTDGVPPIELA